MTPDILIVVPTLGDRPQMLSQALASLARQSLTCRITVVASGDVAAAKDIAEGFGARLITQCGRGLAAAITQGWEDDGWRTAFTGWLGDDDLLPPDSLRIAAGLLEEHPEASMAYGRAEFIDATGSRIHVTRPGRLARWALPYAPNLITQPGTLARTALVRSVGGLDPSLRYTMDLDLFLRLRQAGPLVSTSEILGAFRVHESSITQRFTSEMAQEAEAVRRRYRRAGGLAVALVPIARAAVWTSYGVTRRLLQ